MMLHKRALVGLVLLGSLAAGACDLDLQDPNRPTEDEVFNNPDGLQQLAIGMQAAFADMYRNPVWAVGLITDEIGAGRSTFQDFVEVDAKRELRPGYYNTASFDPWTGMYETIKLANDVLQVTPNAPVLTEGTKSGMIALAKLYKAMALGYLIQLYERVAIDVGPDKNAPLVDRATAIAEVLKLLQEARQQIQTTPPSEVFNQQILTPGFNLPNTIDAMIARYALIANDYQQALQAAQRVNLNVLSTLQFSASDPNSLWNLWYNSGNAYQMRPEQGFRLGAEASDRRVAYWVRPDTVTGAIQKLDDLNRYRERTDAIPIYLPDEMRLIQAEAYARMNQLAQARDLINQVRTQCTSAVAEPTACLPPLSAAQLPTQQAILAEILKQRLYELYLQGLRYEDLRRFGQPLTWRWIPVPLTECTRNTNAGCGV